MSFYTLKQTNGYWAVYDPNDEPVYLTGMNHAGDGSVYPFDMLKRYGSKEEWAASMIRDLRSWGFNYLGPTIAGLYRSKEYLPPDRRDAKKVITDEWPIEELTRLDYPFTIMLQYPGIHEMKPTRHPDVFSDKFLETLDSHCGHICRAVKDNPNFVGYHFTHNPHWSYIDLGIEQDFTQWISTIVNVPGSEARKKWVEVMRRIYGTVERYQEVYYPLEDFADIMELDEPLRGIGGCRHMRNDQIAFIREVAKRWYKGFHDTIRRYDTNHLIFGDRLTLHRQILPPYVLDIMEPYVDALSVVMMGSAEQLMRNMREVLNYWTKPILVADMGARVWDGRIMAGHFCRDYEDLERFYRNHVELGVKHPQLIGLAWCGYWETTGHHSGVKDAVTDTDNQRMAEIMREGNRWAQAAITEEIAKYE